MGHRVGLRKLRGIDHFKSDLDASGDTITHAGTQRAILDQAGQDGKGSLDTTITATDRHPARRHR